MGVRIAVGDDLDQVRKSIGELTEEDCDNWYEVVNSSEPGLNPIQPQDEDDPLIFHTKLKDGACIFANRTDGPAGKPGCAFHHLANRLGVHHSETKPQTCWQIPFDFIETWSERDKLYEVTVTARNGAGWGSAYYGDEPDLKQYVGYWCTETPDAYTATDLVYRHSEVELRKAMGNIAYERMAELLTAETNLFAGDTARRYPMPGEVNNGGRPLLPFLVRERVSMWTRDGDVDCLRRSTYLKGV